MFASHSRSGQAAAGVLPFHYSENRGNAQSFFPVWALKRANGPALCVVFRNEFHRLRHGLRRVRPMRMVPAVWHKQFHKGHSGLRVSIAEVLPIFLKRHGSILSTAHEQQGNAMGDNFADVVQRMVAVGQHLRSG